MKKQNKPKHTAESVIAELKKRGGAVSVWHDLPGMHFAKIRVAVFASGKVEITNQGGLRLVKPKKEKEVDNGQ